MWSRRAQEYEQKITSGKIYDLAEVVRDLNKGDDLMVDQSYSERQLFEKAYERILSEFQIVLNLSYEDIQKKLNKALKRNLENQTGSATTQSKKVQVEQTEDNVEGGTDDLVEENQSKKKRFSHKRYEKRFNSRKNYLLFFFFFSFFLLSFFLLLAIFSSLVV